MQYHPVAGEGQCVVVPIGAPVRGFGDRPGGLAIALAVGETPACQDGQAFGKNGRAVRPGPDKQADTGGVGVTQLSAVHQAGHLAAGIEPAQG